MRALVTGSSGFIGRRVVRELMNIKEIDTIAAVERGNSDFYETEQIFENGPIDIFKILTFKCDVTKSGINSLVLDFKPDVIFHLAGNPNIKEDSSNPVEISETNIISTHRLLSSCKLGTRFVFASSASVYGNNAKYCVTENRTLTPNSIYGATKVASEALINAYSEQGKISSVNLRYVANVGCQATHGVVKDIIRKLKSESPELELIGDCPGSQKHFIYVGDTAKATVKFGLDTSINGNINISTDDVLTTEELAQIIMNTINIHKPIKWLGESANWLGDNKIVFTCNKLAKALGWNPEFPSSKDAVIQTVKETIGVI